MKTFQDFEAVKDNPRELGEFILAAVREHQDSEEYKTAVIAEEYDARKNRTIRLYEKVLYTLRGTTVRDTISANHKMPSGYFPRFVTQQAQYLLGNGMDMEGKEKLGADFDNVLQKLGRSALVQGLVFGFWNVDHVESFALTEFVPLWDEETGALRAGIRFWQIAADKPMRFTLYEEEGITEFRKKKDTDIEQTTDRKTYQQIKTVNGIDGEKVENYKNYPGFPVIPMWANPHHQSEIVGIRQSIDCYDLIENGFANDLDDAALIYWTLENTGGMDDIDLAHFVERMKTVKAAVVGGDDGNKATAHTVDVPHEGREAMLNRIDRRLYRDFQIVDVESLTSGNKTATEITAAYQPMDNKVDQYEWCICDFLKSLLAIVGVEGTPSFRRSRITNQYEETQMVLLARDVIGDDAVRRKLPWLSAEEVEKIEGKLADTSFSRLNAEE